MILFERKDRRPSFLGKRGSHTFIPSHPHASHSDSERWVLGEEPETAASGGVAGGGVHMVSTEVARQTGLLNDHCSVVS